MHVPRFPSAQTIFLLSPAHCGGRRAQLLLRAEAQFPLAIALRTSGATLGEIFTFLSGLYFRGKIAYARAFARGPALADPVLVITPGLGLCSPDRVITFAELREIATVGVSLDEPRYREPLERDTHGLAASLAEHDAAVLLGSIATAKYVDVLEPVLGSRLRFPAEFVGRGDMSRGGLMLRCVSDRRELDYVPLTGAVRHGARPPKLEPIR